MQLKVIENNPYIIKRQSVQHRGIESYSDLSQNHIWFQQYVKICQQPELILEAQPDNHYHYFHLWSSQKRNNDTGSKYWYCKLELNFGLSQHINSFFCVFFNHLHPKKILLNWSGFVTYMQPLQLFFIDRQNIFLTITPIHLDIKSSHWFNSVIKIFFLKRSMKSYNYITYNTLNSYYMKIIRICNLQI